MNSKLKENIGSYIWRKFGTLGLLTGAQLFKPTQFTHLVRTVGSESVLRPC